MQRLFWYNYLYAIGCLFYFMSESSAESIPSSPLWDITRFVIVAVAAGVIIWYNCFYTPATYASKTHTGGTMGTSYKVIVAQFPDNADWKSLTDEIQERLDALDQMMSTFKPDSEVNRFNASRSTEDWFSVSQETAFVVDTALKISHATDGAFDITVAPLVRHWGFGADKIPPQTRSFEEIKTAAAALKEQTGYEKLSVRLDPPALKKEIPELTIDLSAIAKGYAVDCIADLLEGRKLTDYLIEVGGEVRCKGKKGKNKDWIVGVEKPTLEFSGHQQKFVLGDQSMATSGSYQQPAEIDGKRFSHIVDPRTGIPAQVESGVRDLVAVAVISPTCIVADAWATTLFVLGEQKGVKIADEQKLAALFLLRSGDEIVEVQSKQWMHCTMATK